MSDLCRTKATEALAGGQRKESCDLTPSNFATAFWSAATDRRFRRIAIESRSSGFFLQTVRFRITVLAYLISRSAEWILA